MKGERSLSQDNAIALSHALGLSSEESEYFLALVGFNQASVHSDRDKYYHDMTEIVHRHGKPPATVRIREDQYEYYSRWYVSAVRSLLAMYPNESDPATLARRLDPPISVSQVRKSIDILQRLGLVTQNSQKQWQITNTTVTTGPQVLKLALRTFYKDLADLAIESIDRQTREERNLSSLTMGLSSKTYERVVARLSEVRSEILQWIDEDEDSAERIYALTVHLFPLSKQKLEEDRT